jgi:hypothetical protein
MPSMRLLPLISAELCNLNGVSAPVKVPVDRMQTDSLTYGRFESFLIVARALVVTSRP